MRKTGFAPLFIILVLAILGIIGLVSLSILKDQAKPIAKTLPYQDIETFRVEGDKIWDGDSLLFENVNGVVEARKGPDGHTIHFKLAPDTVGAKCADLETKVEPSVSTFSLLPSPAPIKAPWDYKLINIADTIDNCNYNYQLSGAYLDDSSFFVYIKIDDQQKRGSLIFVDLDKNISFSFNLIEDILPGFFENNPSRKQHYWYWATPMVGKDGSFYFYPGTSSRNKNGKYLIGFGRLLFGIDTENQIYLGQLVLAGPNIVSDAIRFSENEVFPVALAVSYWGGAYNLEALIDFSGNDLKIINLNKYGKGHLGLFDIKDIEWKDNSVVVRFFETKFISVGEEGVVAYGKNADKNFVAQKERETEQRLKNQGEYEEVACILTPHQGTGCYAAFNLVSYEYTLGGTFTKID